MSTFETRLNQTRHLLKEAGKHLDKVRSLRRGSDFHALQTESLLTVRRSLEGLLTYHGVPFTDEMPLHLLAEATVELASILRTPMDIALALEKMSVAGRETLPVAEREAVLNGSFAARNVFTMTLGELPKNVTEDALDDAPAAEVFSASP